MLVKMTVRSLLWNCISRDAKFQRILPMSANQGVARMKLTSVGTMTPKKRKN